MSANSKTFYGGSNVDTMIHNVYDELFKDRIIFLDKPVDDITSNLVKAQLLYLDSISNDDIYLYIDTPGGYVYTGLGIIDTMNYIKSDVSTINIGLAASMGAVILASGTKGKRKSLPHSRTMLHQPSGGASGQTTDIIIEATEIDELRTELYKILAVTTNNSMKKIKIDCERDYWLSATKTMEYGIIDEIIYKK